MDYFAYASNLSPATIAATCPGHRFLAIASLPGHRLAFTRRSVRTGSGVADIVPDAASAVWGALYALSGDDLERLDRKEGNGWAYVRGELTVFRDGRTAQRAFAYTVIEKEPEEVAPSLEYIAALLGGAGERRLPPDYIAQLQALTAR